MAPRDQSPAERRRTVRQKERMERIALRRKSLCRPRNSNARTEVEVEIRSASECSVNSKVNSNVKVRKRVKAAGIAGLLILAVGCADKKADQAQQSTIPVTVATVVRKSVPLQAVSIGTTEAYSSVAVKSHLDGQIVEVHFTAGQDVKARDMLFTMDKRPLEADLKRAESTLTKDVA